MTVCKALEKLIDPVKGFFQNLIHSESYFANLKDFEVQKISKRIFKQYNEKNFTALNVTFFTQKQIQKIDAEHLGYWINSKQIEKVIHLLSDAQIVLVGEQKITKGFFENLTYQQRAHLVEQATSNLALQAQLLKTFQILSASCWIDMWKESLKTGQTSVSVALLRYVTMKILTELIKKYSPTDLQNVREFLAQKFPKNNYVEIEISAIFSSFSKNKWLDYWKKIDLNDPQLKPLISFMLNHAGNPGVIDALDELDSEFITKLLSTVPVNQLDQFIHFISPEILEALILDHSAYPSKEYQNAVKKIIAIQKPATRQLLLSNFEKQIEDYQIETVAFILPHFPLYHKLSVKQLIELITKHDLPAKLDVLSSVQVDALIHEVVKTDADVQFSPKLYKLLQAYPVAHILALVTNKSTPVRLYLLDLVRKHFSGVNPDQIVLSQEEWIKILKDSEDKETLVWILENTNNQNLIYSILNKIPSKLLLETLKDRFLSLDKTKMELILKYAPMEVLQGLLNLNTATDKFTDGCLIIAITGLSAAKIKFVLSDEKTYLCTSRALLDLILERQTFGVLDQLLETLANPLKVLQGVRKVTFEQMRYLSKNLSSSAKFRIAKSFVDPQSIGHHNVKLLVPLVSEMDFEKIPLQQLLELLPVMPIPQIKMLFEKKQVKKMDIHQISDICKSIENLEESQQLFAFYELFKQLAPGLYLHILRSSILNLFVSILETKKYFIPAVIAACPESMMKELENFCKNNAKLYIFNSIIDCLQANLRDAPFLFKLAVNLNGQSTENLMNGFTLNDLKKYKFSSTTQEFIESLLWYIIDNPPNNTTYSMTDTLTYLEGVHALLKSHQSIFSFNLLKRNIGDEIYKLKKKLEDWKLKLAQNTSKNYSPHLTNYAWNNSDSDEIEVDSNGIARRKVNRKLKF